MQGSQPVTLALDAMGGDYAPSSVIRGACEALNRYPTTRFLIYGHQEKVLPILRMYPALERASEFFHTEEAISTTDKPSQALRQGKNSSMRLAIEAVRQGKAGGVVSAGNTGALMAMAKVMLKTLPGISRPAIASLFPGIHGECVLLDLGANLDCDAGNLFEFAVMGDAFARAILGLERPRIALLNIGAEEVKGNETIREAGSMLRDTALPLHFVGFIEGNDISQGRADVVVADGFTGNVALKTAEGTGKICSHFLKQAFQSSWRAKFGYLLARPALRALFNRLDPRLYNGGIFLGLNGIVVKSHGGTDWLGFATATEMAVQLVGLQVNDGIIAEMRLFHAHAEGENFGEPPPERRSLA